MKCKHINYTVSQESEVHIGYDDNGDYGDCGYDDTWTRYICDDCGAFSDDGGNTWYDEKGDEKC